MKFFINGENYSVDKVASPVIEDALELFIQAHQASLSFAVALNGTFVSKDTYSTTSIAENDTIDVLFPIVGG